MVGVWGRRERGRLEGHVDGAVVISEGRGVPRGLWLWRRRGRSGGQRACADTLECPRVRGMLLSQSPAPVPGLSDAA